VSVHAGTTAVDLALPAEVPVAALVPSIVDVLDGGGNAPPGAAATRYHLSRPGMASLSARITLAQAGIHDGAVLLLTQSESTPPAPRYDDVAVGVAQCLAATARPGNPPATRLIGGVGAIALAAVGAMLLIRNTFSATANRYDGVTVCVTAAVATVALLFGVVAHRVHRDPCAGLTLSVVATVFATVAALQAVPGAAGGPGVLLGGMTAAASSMLAMRVTGCGVVTSTSISCFGVLIAMAALTGELSGAPPHLLAAATALASLSLLGAAARMSIALAGLSPRPSPTAELPSADRVAARASRADDWLVSLVGAFSSSAACGAVITALTTGFGGAAVAAGTGVLLLLRARSHERRAKLVLTITGITTLEMTFAIAVIRELWPGPSIAAAAAALTGTAAYLGFAAPRVSLAPVARRGVDALECVILTAMLPLTCWICGVFTAVRGLNLK